MNTKTILQGLVLLMVILTFFGISQAQCNGGSSPGGGFGNIEIQPDCPPEGVQPEIVGASYSDAWLEAVPSPNTTIQIDAAGFTNYSEDVHFAINNRVVTDMNPASPYSLYCPVVQLATVLKYHSRETGSAD